MREEEAERILERLREADSLPDAGSDQVLSETGREKKVRASEHGRMAEEGGGRREEHQGGEGSLFASSGGEE